MVFLRDMSHFDGNESLAGFVGTTHKVTEGTSFVDPMYAGRMSRYHAAGVPVLGSYHVLHTANLSAQLDFWLSTMDRLTPWWRTHPAFILQIDAEKWPNDPVTLADGTEYVGPLHPVRHLLSGVWHAEILAARISTTVTFAGMLVDSGVPGWKVTYASRGQYGDSLSGIATPLWNAAYHSATYLGDGAADWAPYSGKAPALWQYTSTPFDKSAFRGSQAELLALIQGDDMLTDEQAYQLANIASVVASLGTGAATFQYRTSQTAPWKPLPNDVAAKLGALSTGNIDLKALAAALAPLLPQPPTAAEVAKAVLDAEAQRLANG